MSQVEGLQKTVSSLRGQKRRITADKEGLLKHLQRYGDLADKARLIHDGVYQAPEFDEAGVIADYGWEDPVTYSPSRCILPQNIEGWRDIESDDSDLIRAAIAKWGIEVVCEEFRHYSWDGAHKRSPIYTLRDGQHEIVGWQNA